MKKDKMVNGGEKMIRKMGHEWAGSFRRTSDCSAAYSVSLLAFDFFLLPGSQQYCPAFSIDLAEEGQNKDDPIHSFLL